jgi:hypothetical protein
LRRVVEWGTTHVELVQACEKLNVPRPDNSYWSRLQTHMPVEALPLLELEPGSATECLLRRKDAASRLGTG